MWSFGRSVALSLGRSTVRSLSCGDALSLGRRHGAANCICIYIYIYIYVELRQQLWPALQTGGMAFNVGCLTKSNTYHARSYVLTTPRRFIERSNATLNFHCQTTSAHAQLSISRCSGTKITHCQSQAVCQTMRHEQPHERYRPRGIDITELASWRLKYTAPGNITSSHKVNKAWI